MASENRPSKKQRELLGFIEAFISGHGYGPSYREVMRALDYKSVSTVAVHIDGLIAKGHLIKRDRSARSLEVVKQSVGASSKTVAPGEVDEKWLVALIQDKFEAYEKKPSEKARDNLYVLVGALQVLGFTDAATMFKARLHNL